MQEIKKRIFGMHAWQFFLLIMLPYLPFGEMVEFILVLGLVVFAFIWAWLLAEELVKKFPGGHTMNHRLFQFNAVYCLVYYFALVFFFDGGYTINNENAASYGYSLYIILPLHIYLMFAFFYNVYFLAKAIKMAETRNKDISFADFGGVFLAFFFYPVGVWFVQPRIRDLLT
jgi:hypothetical protein